MSYCYSDDDTSDQASSPNHYHHLMPDSPLQPKLSANNPNSNNHLSRGGSSMSPNTQLEHEKRVRREIANSNERRRMQSINTGFQSLKILIPHSCGEKLSKACILQRAADHIKSLENEKMKLQSQNEQFRILIKSFQIDSTSVLQEQRHSSTNSNSDETVLLLNNEAKNVRSDDSDPDQLRSYQDIKSRHVFIPNWHIRENLSHHSSSARDETQGQHHYPSSSSYGTIQSSNSKSSSIPSDTSYMIVKTTNQPSQRSYKTISLDLTNENRSETHERFQSRPHSVDTNNNPDHFSTSSTNVLNHPVSRRNLQTIVEAIRHLEGDDALSNITPPQSSTSSTHQEDLPAQIKAMIHEKFQQQNNKTFQQTINIYEQSAINLQPQQQQQQQQTHSISHEIDIHQKPPKKRKITYNENDDLIEQAPSIPKQELAPISSPDVHHHEQISTDDSPPSQSLISNLVVHSPSSVNQLLQEHLLQRTIRYPSSHHHRHHHHHHHHPN